MASSCKPQATSLNHEAGAVVFGCMNKRRAVMGNIKCLLVCAVLLAFFQPDANAGLTFSEGLKAHGAGDYENAILIFERLAELGHAPAQYNLAAMFYRGEGVVKDPVKAYGWFYLAGDGGDQEAGKISGQIYKKLSPLDQIEAIKLRDSLVAGHGKAALNASLIPELTQTDMGYCKIDRVGFTAPKYPNHLMAKGVQGWVDFEFTISKEGRVKDIFVIESAPKDDFVKAAASAIRKNKYTAPLVDGRNSEVYGYKSRVIFKFDGEAPEEYKKKLNDFVTEFLKKAQEGDPYHQYLYAYVMGVHPDLSIDPQEGNEWFLKAAQGGFPPAQYSLAFSLLYGQGCVPDNAKAIEWLTRAAQADYAPAQLLLGRLLLKLTGQAEKEKGVFWHQKAADNRFVPASMAFGWIRATSRDEKLRNPDEALKLVRPVYEAYLDQVTALETMAAAYAGTGDFKRAVKFQKLAIKEAKNLEWSLEQMQLRMDAYSAGKAWYES
jgi:uncharacterized protein